MYQRLNYRILALIGFALVSATITRGQSLEKTEVLTINPNDTWQGAQLIGSSKAGPLASFLSSPSTSPTSANPAASCLSQSTNSSALAPSEVLAPFCRSKLPPSLFPVTDA